MMLVSLIALNISILLLSLLNYLCFKNKELCASKCSCIGATAHAMMAAQASISSSGGSSKLTWPSEAVSPSVHMTFTSFSKDTSLPHIPPGKKIKNKIPSVLAYARPIGPMARRPSAAFGSSVMADCVKPACALA